MNASESSRNFAPPFMPEPDGTLFGDGPRGTYREASDEVIRLKRDADRYQFIKAQYARMNPHGHYLNSPLIGRREQTFDEAIDEAMSK